MQRTPLAGLQAYVSQDPLDIEDDSPGGLQGFGPELILVLTALTSVALVAGAVSAQMVVPLLAGSAGLVIGTGLSRTVLSPKQAKAPA